MSFDIEPDDDIHGQCAHEIKRLEAKLIMAENVAHFSRLLLDSTISYTDGDVKINTIYLDLLRDSLTKMEQIHDIP